MLPTRVLLARSVWKGPNIVPYVLSCLHCINTIPIPIPIPILNHDLPLPAKLPPPPGTPPIRTQKRGATILPNFVGLKFAVHNGKVYHEFIVTENMVGRKLGEFSPTRKLFRYKGNTGLL